MPIDMKLSDKLKEMVGILEPETPKLLSKVKDKIVGRADYDADARDLVGGESMYTGGWQDKQDAARHMLAVGELARRTNPTVAKALAGAYEFIIGNASVEDAAMDEHNNRLALTLYNAKDYNEVKERVKKLMEDPKFKDFSYPDKPVINRIDPRDTFK